MRNAQVDNSKWESELVDFLRSYKATPHKTTGVSTNELLFKTKSTTSRLPVVFESDVSGLVPFSPDTVEDEVAKKARIFDFLIKTEE